MASTRSRTGLGTVAAALAAATVLHAGVAAGHESHRHRLPVPPPAGIAAADEAQSRHDFDAARAELDQLLTSDPRDLEARLMRANLALLAGEFSQARRDCRAVLEIGHLYAGTVCTASAQTGPGSVSRARAMLEALGEDDSASIELRRWRLLTEADLAARADDNHSALELLERAHALNPAHEEARTQLAELLLEQGDVARSLTLSLAPEPAVARLVVRLRAALALGDRRASDWHRELDAMLDKDRRRGIPTHLREESQIARHVDNDVIAALALALRNFATQKDTRDLRLLVGAANAADDRRALAAVRDWLRRTGFEDHVVVRQVGVTDSVYSVGAPDGP